MDAMDDWGWRSDTECEAKTIKEVERHKDRFTLHFADGLCFSPRNPKRLQLPKPGDTALLFGRGLGYPIRGFVVNGRCYFYETPSRHEARLKAEQEARRTEKRANFEAKRDQWNANLAALPAPFRARIERFAAKTDWDWDFGPDEMFSCQEAVKIAEACGSADAVARFHGASWEEQKVVVPTLSHDHSGNTFGAACHLAGVFLTDPDMVPKAHGALCPLVGCESYGCWAASEEVSECQS